MFDEHSSSTSNPVEDIKIHSISTGRDDFGHAAFRLTTREMLFRFDLGRGYSRALTEEERAAFPYYETAYVTLIVDRHLSEEQRASVQGWLQAGQDAVTRQRPPDIPRSLMLLESVPGIEGY